MLASARQRAWRMAGVCALLPARGGFVGRAFSPAAWASRHRRVSGTMPASSPTDVGQGPAGLYRIFPPQSGNAPLRLRLAAHPPPLAGEALGELPFERLPCKGLRSRAPPAADTARRSRCGGRRMQARFSMRRMMRAPQTGNVGVSRLRGAAPCRANILPGGANLPGGRERPPGKFAAADGFAAGEIARPTTRPHAGGNTKSAAARQARRRAGAGIAPCPGVGGLPFSVPLPVCPVL